MENINKNLIYFFVVITLVLGFSLVVPNFASAQYTMRSGEMTVRSGVTFTPDIAINNNNNTNWFDTLNQGVQVANPVPSIFSINPNSWNINKGTTTITITGTNFIPNSFVRFNNIDHPTTYINSGTLQFKLNSSDLSVGNFPIVVANMGPGGGLSNVVTINLNKNQTTSSNTTSGNTTSKTSGNVNNGGNDLSANALFGSNGFIPSTFLQWVAVFILILLIIVLWRKLYVSEKDKVEPLKHH